MNRAVKNNTAAIILGVIPFVLILLTVGYLLINNNRNFVQLEAVPQVNRTKLTFESLFLITSVGSTDSAYFTDTDNLNFAGTDSHGTGVYLYNQGEELTVYYYHIEQPNSASERFEDRNAYIDRVYVSDKELILFQFYKYGDSLAILELYYDESNMLKFMLTDVNSSTEIFSDFCEGIPYIQPIDTNGQEKNVLINYSHDSQSKLLLTREFNFSYTDTVAVEQFEVYNSNSEAGRKIFYAGGYGDYIYYQVIQQFSNISATFEQSEEAFLYRYHMKTKEIDLIAETDTLSLFISGNSNFYITSEYKYEKPVYGSGKITAVKNKKAFGLDFVESGNDIQSVWFDGENTMSLLSSRNFARIDFEKRMIRFIDFEEYDFYGKPIILNDSLCYLEKDSNNDYYFCKINIIND